MCGIAGQIRARGEPVDAGRIAAMAQVLRHRGPDDGGVHVRGHVGLAHRRLSVIDLSPAGRQPMSNESGTVWIVFNGEIYNFEELRRDLVARHTFRSRSDTEVLLHLYEEEGIACVAKLRGMFAFAIWDEPAQRLILARDRIGKKPLFYSVSDDGIRFGSELKALLLEERTEKAIDPLALHHYLTFQYIPAPRTIFRGIRKLKPGHLLVYERGKASELPYWSLSYRPKRRGSLDEHLAQFRHLLEESVRLRLSSDVPLGAFLSGGLDSSSIVAIMARCCAQPVKTFSIGFKDDRFNELPYSRMVARHCKTEHHEFVLDPSALDILPTLVRVYDEPYADSSAIPTYYVARLSRQSVTVVLNGDGGDELLGGYPRYHYQRWERLLWSSLSTLQQRRVRHLTERVAGFLPSERLVRVVRRLAGSLSGSYLQRICYFSSEEKARLYHSDFKELVEEEDSEDLLESWLGAQDGSDLLDRLLSVDVSTYLPDDLLVKVDRATMAHGLEARSPLLDHRLMEFAATLPTELKVRQGEGKYLLKLAMQEMLPRQILERPKQGFGVPLDGWFRDDGADFLRDVLLSSHARARGVLEPREVERLIDAHQTGVPCGYKLYALVMLELWYRAYIDGAAEDGQPLERVTCGCEVRPCTW